MAATPLGLTEARKFEANPTGAVTDNLLTIDLGGTIFDVDELQDVTGLGLPGLTQLNYRRLFVDHDTPRVWVGHRELLTASSDADGDFSRFAHGDFRGEHTDDNEPASPQAGEYYYNTTVHGWYRAVVYHGSTFWEQADITHVTILGSGARWLGEQRGDTAAANLIENFNTNRFVLLLPHHERPR